MSDNALMWGGDLAAGNTGDLSQLTGVALSQQRVLRRLLTSPGDYLWDLNYGAGLGRFVGSPTNVAAIRSAIRSQIFQEASVARLPEPFIDVQSSSAESVYVSIRYVDSSSGMTQVLSFSVTP